MKALVLIAAITFSSVAQGTTLFCEDYWKRPVQIQINNSNARVLTNDRSVPSTNLRYNGSNRWRVYYRAFDYDATLVLDHSVVQTGKGRAWYQYRNPNEERFQENLSIYCR
jgi:hypothetical protein